MAAPSLQLRRRFGSLASPQRLELRIIIVVPLSLHPPSLLSHSTTVLEARLCLRRRPHRISLSVPTRSLQPARSLACPTRHPPPRYRSPFRMSATCKTVWRSCCQSTAAFPSSSVWPFRGSSIPGRLSTGIAAYTATQSSGTWSMSLLAKAVRPMDFGPRWLRRLKLDVRSLFGRRSKVCHTPYLLHSDGVLAACLLVCDHRYSGATYSGEE